MSLDMPKICELCGENIHGYGHKPSCPQHADNVDYSDDHYTGPRGGEAEAEQRHRQAEIQRTKR